MTTQVQCQMCDGTAPHDAVWSLRITMPEMMRTVYELTDTPHPDDRITIDVEMCSTCAGTVMKTVDRS